MLSLYKSVGWSAYVEDFKALEEGIAHSLKVVTAWQDNQLVGLIRVVGDGQTIIYIQDILVKPEFQGNDLGSELIQRILVEYQKVRQSVLMTEEIPSLRGFYEKHGFKYCDQGQVVSFAIFK